MYGYVIAALIGFASAWDIQSLRWSKDLARVAQSNSESIAANVNAVNDALNESRQQTEAIRQTFIDFKTGASREINSLESDVAAGKRLRIGAKCPAVPAAGADSSGIDSGTAELDAAATRTYFQLERGLAEQYGLLQFCRQELIKRSAKEKAH